MKMQAMKIQELTDKPLQIVVIVDDWNKKLNLGLEISFGGTRVATGRKSLIASPRQQLLPHTLSASEQKSADFYSLQHTP